MKLNNELLVVDLEATAVEEKVAGQLVQRNNCIIEIGAVFLDRNLTQRDSFSQSMRLEAANRSIRTYHLIYTTL